MSSTFMLSYFLTFVLSEDCEGVAEGGGSRLWATVAAEGVLLSYATVCVGGGVSSARYTVRGYIHVVATLHYSYEQLSKVL